MPSLSRKERLEALLVDAPNDPELLYALAMEYVSVQDDDTAVRCFRDMLSVTPEYAPAYHQAGQALARLGRLEEAREILIGGIAAARKIGNLHAAEEMQGLMESLT